MIEIDEITQLVKLAKKGDQDALMTLLLPIQDQLYKTAWLMTHNEQDALDIVQETALQVVLSIKRLQQPQFFKTWVIRILLNVAKKSYRRTIDNIVEENIDTSSEIFNHLVAEEMLGKLPQKQKEVVILFYYDDLTIEEVARVINRPLGTAKSRLNRALIKLRKEGAGLL